MYFIFQSFENYFIHNNIKTIKSVPLQLRGDYPVDFEIRGEIFFPLDNFEKLNKLRAENEEPLYANPRNTASGTLKSLDSKIVADRGLDCFLYGIYGDDLKIDNHFDLVKKAGDRGFIPLDVNEFADQLNRGQMADMMKALGGKKGKGMLSKMMGGLGGNMGGGMGGLAAGMRGMPDPSAMDPKQLEALSKQMGGSLPGTPKLPGLGGPKLPGLGGTPFGGKKK